MGLAAAGVTPGRTMVLSPSRLSLPLCSAAVTDSVAVVSPHLSNAPSPEHAITVDLTLDEEQQHTTNSGADNDDVSRLSLDQCADIVDVCLFGERFHTNHYDFDGVSSTPSKRIKIEL